jgi:SRSO17 transposase
MKREELDSWAEEFAAFHERFAAVFGRKEPRQQAVKYVRGLLSESEHKNGWQLAEAVGEPRPDAMQRLLYQSHWEADAARDVLQGFIIERFGDEEGIGVVDETGFLKKGTHSVGVKRQYSGTAGKVENCQVGTFLSYATPQGHVFLDRCLYLPEEWCNDPVRRRQAKVPEEVLFQTKPEQAMAMLQHAWAQGVPMRWVTGDEVYGDSTALRSLIQANQRWYVLAVKSDMPVWSVRPPLREPTKPARGRPAVQLRLAAEAPAATPVIALVASWPAHRWHRLTVAEGEKGPRTYDWAAQRIVESRTALPGPDAWLLARRSLSQPEELAYYLSNAPSDTPLLKLAQVASTRFTVEQCIEEAKGETGLDHYEVRSWQSWYRHITLSLMAHAWLAALRNQEKKRCRTIPRSTDRPRSPPLTRRGLTLAAALP